MDDEKLKRAQYAQFLIAKEIRRVCEKNNIQYSLIAGTLIGAVRHKGFIPWDDDLDIGMVRSEYDRFVECCKSDLRPEFFLQTMDTDPEYSWPFLKVRLNHTHYKPEWDPESVHDGIWVDVFPADKVPASAFSQKLLRVRFNFYLRMLHIRTGMTGFLEESSAKRMLKGFIRFCSHFCSYEKNREIVKTMLGKYSMDEKCRSGFVAFSDELQYRLPKELFEEYKMTEFCGEDFMTVKDTDRLLTIEYGDYMQLPPEEERYNMHKIEKYEIPDEIVERVEKLYS